MDRAVFGQNEEEPNQINWIKVVLGVGILVENPLDAL
jgi:hypothetical protein